MKFSAILLSVALYFISSTEAGITTNTPFEAVTWNGGDTESVVWNDDGKAPTLDQIGLTSVDLMAGGDVNQVLVVNIAKVPATAKQAKFKVPKDVGPPGNFYFIKYTAKDYSSFSGTFSIANVNGKIQGLNPKDPNAKAADPKTADPKAITDPKAKDGASPPTYGGAPPPTGPTGGDASKTGGANNTNSAIPATPATPATPTANALPAVDNAANLFPSFGVATAAIVFALTYLY